MRTTTLSSNWSIYILFNVVRQKPMLYNAARQASVTSKLFEPSVSFVEPLLQEGMLAKLATPSLPA